MNGIAKCKSLLLHIALGTALAGCSGKFPLAQTLEIKQGNSLDREEIARIETGMSKSQVVQVLGRPVLEHPFSEERWDYLFLHHGGNSDGKVRKRLTLFFEQGRVAKIEDHWPEG